MTSTHSSQHENEVRSALRARLRALPSLVGTPFGFDPNDVPAAPQSLFEEWLTAAEAAGIPEPHAMNVSTIDSDGLPDARVLILKDITPEGSWCFAGKRDSSKGQQLATHPVAALTFYWREQLRSVRVRGTISEGSQDESIADFSARSLNARMTALSGRQSAPLGASDDLTSDVEVTRRRLVENPDLIPDGWTVWKLDPIAVEFWEGSDTRVHTRLRYDRTSDGWQTSRLRP